KDIEVLRLCKTAITDAAMKDIATLPKLKILELRGCSVTDLGLAQLREMKLEELNVRSTKITDLGIDSLKNMATLKLLEVNDTKVTDAAAAKLSGIPGLKFWGALEKNVKVVPDDPTDAAAIEAALGPYVAVKDNATGNIHSVQATHDKQK